MPDKPESLEPSDQLEPSTEAPPPRWRFWAGLLIRVAVGVGLMAYLAYTVNWHDTTDSAGKTEPGLSTTLTRLDWRWAAPAAVLYIAPHLLISVRWWLLMRKVPGLSVTLADTLKLNLIGVLFNNFALGAGGGDLAKAYHITRRTPEHRPEAVTVLFLDRFLGLMALFVMAAFAMVWQTDDERIARAGWFVWSVLTVGVLGTLFFASRTIRESALFEAVISRLPLSGLVRRIDATVRLFRNTRKTVLAAMLISWTGHVLYVLGSYAVVRALRLENTDLGTLFAVLPVIWTISAIPLTPGALGIQEGVYLFFQASLSCSRPEVLALSLMARVLNLTAGLPGAVILMLGSHSPPEPPMPVSSAGPTDEANATSAPSSAVSATPAGATPA